MSDLAIRGGTPVRTQPFPVWPPHGNEEREALLEVLDRGIWSSAEGPKVTELEQKFAAFHDAAHGVGVMCGTIALEIALGALGIGSGDEVIVPAYTFLATATAVLKMNAMPIFVDIDPETYNIDPDAVEAAITPRTKAVIPVHFGGHPADMDRLLAIKAKYGIAIIEDAAHAHGASWNGRKVGAIGDIGAWSFQASKNMTGGEGGMVTTNSAELEEIARSLHNCGRTVGGEWYEHHRLGGNYRMTEFQSTLLLTQLARLPEYVARREAAANYLDREIATISGLRPMTRDPRATMHAHHLYMFRYDAEAFGGVDHYDFVDALRAEGIPAIVGYPIPLTRQPVFAKHIFDHRATGFDPNYAPTQYANQHLPVTEAACNQTVWLTQNMLLGTDADMQDIMTAIHKVRAASDSLRPAVAGH